MSWNFEHSYAMLPATYYRDLLPEEVPDPQLLVFNEPLAALLGLDYDPNQAPLWAEILSGKRLPEGARPLAQAYAGHQFGYFTMLGDGRALLLGEQITPSGERFDVVLKGSGRTPFSRGGDGRAALGPMLREYIISEAMSALGIPTTRSLAVVATGAPVQREGLLPGAVLTRIAASHIRVGTFEYAARFCGRDDLEKLAAYTMRRHFPEITATDDPYLAFFVQVMERQIKLVAQWLQFGFIHGVMNTDNMSICGETIDYGPCAFMDHYDPQTVFSSIDGQGRYAFLNQPDIALWNLARFAETLIPLSAVIHGEKKAIEIFEDQLSKFSAKFRCEWLSLMAGKLGFKRRHLTTMKLTEIAALVEPLLNLMQRFKADYTNTFRNLRPSSLSERTGQILFQHPDFDTWKKSWEGALDRHGISRDEAVKVMQAHNPAVIPRNARVEEALDKAVNDGELEPLRRLLQLLSQPFADIAPDVVLFTLPPESDAPPYMTFCGT